MKKPRVRFKDDTKLVCLGHINDEWVVWDEHGNEEDEHGPYITRINLQAMREKVLIRDEITDQWIPLLYYTRPKRLHSIVNEFDHPRFPKLPNRAYEYAHARWMEEPELEEA